jgi:hypothetical protein
MINTINEIIQDFPGIEKAVIELEFRRMFTNKMDPASALLIFNLAPVEPRLKIGLKCF